MKQISTKLILPVLFAAITLAFGCSKKEVAPKPSVNFTYIVMDPIPPARVEFSNHAVNATSFSWDFGDNTSSTAKDPEHFYTKAGTYVVTLRATGNTGTEEKKYQLTVGAKVLVVRSIRVTQVANLPDTAVFNAVVTYDGGGYRLPGYSYEKRADLPLQPLAVWGGERFYGIPIEEPLTINLFYKTPGKPNEIPVGEDKDGTFKFRPADLTTGTNPHPTDIVLENGVGAIKNKILLKVSWQ